MGRRDCCGIADTADTAALSPHAMASLETAWNAITPSIVCCIKSLMVHLPPPDAFLLASLTLWSQSGFRPEIPKVWDEAALADWVTPLAELNVRPTHMSANEYYSMPEYNLLSYPAYMPGREPEGYWEMLQHIGPKPLVEPETLKTEAEWIAAGRRISKREIHRSSRSRIPR
jgi:hypothetical protein